MPQGRGRRKGGGGILFFCCCCVCVTSFEHQLTPLCVDSKVVAFVGVMLCRGLFQQLLFLLHVCV